MISSTVEDYLKAFLKMEDRNEKASTSNVARHLDVADASVTDMLRKLQKAGLLEYKPYYGASLTNQGRLVALKILRRHRLIELFLTKVMGYGWEEVHDEAEKLEHIVSDFFVDRIDGLLGYPDKDPHGEAIPDAQGFRSLEEDISLANAELGEYTIRKVTNTSPEFLAYLEQESLMPSTTLALQERAPFQGPLKLRVNGKSVSQYIGLEVAKSIFVAPGHTLASRSVTRRERPDHTFRLEGVGDSLMKELQPKAGQKSREVLLSQKKKRTRLLH